MTRRWWTPALYDWVLAATEARGLADRRRRLVGSAEGRVLEIGAGTGLNLRGYRPERVTSIVALEPDAAMATRLAWRAATLTVPVEVLTVTAEDAELAEQGFDTVVATLALCSVADLPAVAAAVFRWLKPGGRLLFIEHVAARGGRGWLQSTVSPLWGALAGGCHLHRDTLGALRGAGLSVSDCERFALPAAGPLFHSSVQAVAWRPPIGEPDPAMSVLAPAGAGKDGP